MKQLLDEDQKAVDAILKRFRKAVKDLNKAQKDLKKFYSQANYYLAMEDLHMMIGPSHTDENIRIGVAKQSNILDSCRLDNSGGGDW